jgi:excisionase family DNA binding protein
VGNPSVRTLIRRGDLPAVRDTSLSGHPYLIDREDLDEYRRRAECPALGSPISTSEMWARKGYLTLDQAADELGVDSPAVWNLLHTGRLRGCRRGPGGRYRVHRDAISEYRATPEHEEPNPTTTVSQPDDEWLTAADAAEILGCTRANIHLLIKSGKLRAERRGLAPTSPYRIHRSWLDAYSPRRTPDMLTVPEAATEVSSGVDALWAALSGGRLHGVRLGPRRLIRREDLRRYRQDRETRYARVSASVADRHRRDVESLHEEGYLTVKEAADELGVSRAVVQQRIRAGLIRSVRIGWRYGIRPEWIEEYRAAHPLR